MLSLMVLVVVLSSRDARAQAAPHAHSRSVDLSLGGWLGQGAGDIRSGGGIALDVLAAQRLRASGPNALVFALALDGHGTIGVADDCVIRADASRPGCLPMFPYVLSSSLLGGWERRGARGGRRIAPAVRLLAGPAFIRYTNAIKTFPPGSTAGLQGRIDLATSSRGGIALLTSLRGTLIPSIGGETLTMWALGFGLRFH